MRKSARIAALVAGPIMVLGIGAAAAAPAFASTGPSNGQSAQQTGNTRAATYPDPFFGGVKCNETQHPAFDTVACKSTTGSPLTNVAPGAIGSVGWNSDFLGSGHTTGVLTYTVSADGLSYTGQATYPNG
jgi:hypothetical protein